MTKVAFGAEFWMAPAGSPLVKMPGLQNINAPKPSRGVMDTTAHDSPLGAMEFITEGIYDPGEAAGTMNYVAGSAGDLAFVAARDGGGMQDCKIVVKAATGTVDLTFSGYVTTYGVDDLPTNGKQTASFAIKASGALDQAATP